MVTGCSADLLRYHARPGEGRRLSALRNGRSNMLLGGALAVNKGKHKYIPLLYILLLSVPCWAQGDFLMVTHGEPNARRIKTTDLKFNAAGLTGPTTIPQRNGVGPTTDPISSW